MAGQIPHDDVERQRAAGDVGPLDGDRGGVLFELPHRRPRRGLELRRRRLDAELVAKRFIRRSMKALPPRNVCRARPGRSSPSTEATRTGPAARGMWHDWQLRRFLEEGAVPPFLIVHLLRQRSDDLSVGTEGLGDERVAGGAELGLLDVRRLLLLEPGHRVHDAAAAGIDGERAEGAAGVPSGERRGDDEVAVEALARAEPVGGDLVADRARHAVAGQRVECGARVAGRIREMREDRALSAGRVRDLLRRRQVAGRALVLDLARRATDGRSSRGGRWRARTGRGRSSP